MRRTEKEDFPSVQEALKYEKNKLLNLEEFCKTLDYSKATTINFDEWAKKNGHEYMEYSYEAWKKLYDIFEKTPEVEKKDSKEKEEKLYTVNYFNPIGNCECVEHVKATCPLGAAFIAHASNWTPQREFDFDDYNVTEFYPDYFRTLKDVKWTELEAATALKKAMETYVLDQWRWCYKKTNDIDGLTADCNDKFEIKKEEVEKILKEAGAL